VLIREIRVYGFHDFNHELRANHGKHQLQTRAHSAIAIKANTPEKPVASTWKYGFQTVKNC
jgi:hypothetical protein